MIDVCNLLIKYVMICGGLLIVGFLTEIIIAYIFDNNDDNDDNEYNENNEDNEDNEDLENIEDKG